MDLVITDAISIFLDYYYRFTTHCSYIDILRNQNQIIDLLISFSISIQKLPRNQIIIIYLRISASILMNILPRNHICTIIDSFIMIVPISTYSVRRIVLLLLIYSSASAYRNFQYVEAYYHYRFINPCLYIDMQSKTLFLLALK